MQGESILRPPLFDGSDYIKWKKRMKTFIQSVDFNLWLIIKNGPNISKKIVDGIEVEKSEDEFDDEDKKSMEQDLRAKHILYCALIGRIVKEFRCAEQPNRFGMSLIVVIAFVKQQHMKFVDREMERADASSGNSLGFVREIERVDASSETSQLKQSVVSDSHQEERYNVPSLIFLEETREAMEKYITICAPLYKFALEGNWEQAKLILDKDYRLMHAAIATGYDTVLHIAAGACDESATSKHVHFVKELLQLLDDSDLLLKNYNGNTAFCLAAAAGNMEVVKLMLKRNPHMATCRGANGTLPVQFAAWNKRYDMVSFLHGITKSALTDDDWNMLFFTSIQTANYGLALKIAKDRPTIAFARDENNETAMHVLAQKPLNSFQSSKHLSPFMKSSHGDKQNKAALELVRVLWDTILRLKSFKSEIIVFISEPSQLLFTAVKVGNFGLLSELIGSYPSLIWEMDNRNQSLIHTAVEYRQTSIFNLIREIGSQKDIIRSSLSDDNNTLLHLAAIMPPANRLQSVSGAAFQMCVELLWFEEVKKIMPPSLVNLVNSEGLTASELFTIEHTELRKNAECWMKSTAENCMLISTVIATGVFTAAISLPGGLDDKSGKPNYLDKPAFLIFAISDSIALIFSTSAILSFLSILVSRYAEYDFYMSLPFKLTFGLLALFCSITSMMVAFGSAFFITYNYGSKWVPTFISVLAGLPVLLFLVMQFSLWLEIIYSTFSYRKLFKTPSKILY